MCGIFGYFSWSGDDLARPYADQALDRLTHRGPDSRGVWEEPGVFLGSRRLSIIDVAGGDQPIWNEDETLCIVYNGELYNFRDIRRILEAKGHRFSTLSDGEVVLHAFEEWGPRALDRFNGMFAFAIWDRRRRSLFLARDRIGEKPLYYFEDGTRIVFASETKALLADPSLPRELDPQGLVNFLTFGHAVAPRTAYSSIYKLLPGHYLVADANGITTREYWDVGASSPGEFYEGAEDTDLATLIDDSVKLRLMSDVPLGAFLSGGVDSTTVVALMKRHAGTVKTFSLGFDIGGAYDESSDARRVAEEIGTEHHELRVEHAELVDTLRKLVYHYDEPFGDAAAFPVYLLSRYAAEHVKVVLIGDGGDELFGGYRRYAADQAAAFYSRIPDPVARFVAATADRLPRTRRIKRTVNTLRIGDAGKRYASWLAVFSPEMLNDLLLPSLAGGLGYSNGVSTYAAYYNRLDAAAASDHLNRMMYVDLKTTLVDGYMEKVDKATMAASLEARPPLLDPRIVERAFRIPGRHKIKGWSTKRVLKDAVADLVPDWVLRKPKHGFSVPIDPWFRGELSRFAFEVLLDDATTRRGYFDADVIERLWREHQDGRHVWNDQLWLLLVFELWHRTYLDAPA